MRIDIVTKEFPPEIYGGAGVHVAELSRVLAQHVDLQVRAFDGLDWSAWKSFKVNAAANVAPVVELDVAGEGNVAAAIPALAATPHVAKQPLTPSPQAGRGQGWG